MLFRGGNVALEWSACLRRSTFLRGPCFRFNARRLISFFRFLSLVCYNGKIGTMKWVREREQRWITVNCYRCIQSGFYRFLFFFLYIVCDTKCVITKTYHVVLSISKIDKGIITKYSIELSLIKIGFKRRPFFKT